MRIALDIGGNTPIQMAAWFAPILVTGLLSALAVGRMVGKVPASYIMVVGQIAYLLTALIMVLRPPHSTYWTYFFFGTVSATIGIDTSLPAAAMIFASALPRQYQGMGGSIVMTIVNYSISLGLGFAGTIEMNISNGGRTKEDLLFGYRGTLWFSVGLTGSGTVLSLIFLLKDHRKKQPNEHELEEYTTEKQKS